MEKQIYTNERGFKIKMEKEIKPDLDSWIDFSGDWLKAEQIQSFPVRLPCYNVTADFEEGKSKLILHVEYNGRKKKFDLNKMNQNFLKTRLESPKEIIGKMLVINKTQQRNPTTHVLVDSLLIVDLE